MDDELAMTASERLVRKEDLVSCDVAFIDCKLPGSTPKLNYSIVGAGVTQSAEQVVNIVEPHGFAIGVAAMPNGVTNNLHIHYTAEVFMIFRGEWLFRWGADGTDGEIVGRAGDVISIPTWIFRGFTNVGPDDGWIFTALGRDESGGVIWHPTILRSAAEHGLYLKKNNMMVDVSTGAEEPADDELMQPLSDEFIANLRRYSVNEMCQRLTTADERQWSSCALLDSALPGHRAELAPAIGFGMAQDRDAAPKVTNPHGFTVEWMRIDPGNSVGPFRLQPKQVLIVQQGAVEITLGLQGSQSSATARPWDLFAMPADVWRTIRSVGDEPAVLTVTTAGDGRALIEWDPAIVAAALEMGAGIDPNGYIACADYLPFVEAA